MLRIGTKALTTVQSQTDQKWNLQEHEVIQTDHTVLRKNFENTAKQETLLAHHGSLWSLCLYEIRKSKHSNVRGTHLQPFPKLHMSGDPGSLADLLPQSPC